MKNGRVLWRLPQCQPRATTPIPSKIFKKRETLPKTVSRSCREAVRKETGLPGRGLRTLKLVSRKFIAGQVTLFFHVWNKLTNDPYVLDIILCGVKLDFIQPPPFNYSHIQTHFSTDQELTILLQVICPTMLSPTSFATEKKDGSNRLILNLKHLMIVYVMYTSKWRIYRMFSTLSNRECGWRQLTYVMPTTLFLLPETISNTSPFHRRVFITVTPVCLMGTPRPHTSLQHY